MQKGRNARKHKIEINRNIYNVNIIKYKHKLITISFWCNDMLWWLSIESPSAGFLRNHNLYNCSDACANSKTIKYLRRMICQAISSTQHNIYGTFDMKVEVGQSLQISTSGFKKELQKLQVCKKSNYTGKENNWVNLKHFQEQNRQLYL